MLRNSQQVLSAELKVLSKSAIQKASCGEIEHPQATKHLPNY